MNQSGSWKTLSLIMIHSHSITTTSCHNVPHPCASVTKQYSLLPVNGALILRCLDGNLGPGGK